MPKYKLLAGIHAERDPSGAKHLDGTPREIVFRKGDVFESRYHLEALNAGDQEMFRKFERVPDDVPATAAAAPPATSSARAAPEPPEAGGPGAWEAVKAMNVTELKNLAAEEEINLGAAKTRDDILRVLEQHLK